MNVLGPRKDKVDFGKWSELQYPPLLRRVSEPKTKWFSFYLNISVYLR